jgi:DNA-binding beta-propeller fold protein YncE
MSTGQSTLFGFPRRKMIAAALLIAALAWVLLLSYQYYDTRKPIQELPGLPVVGQVIPKSPPRFLRTFTGTQDEPLAGPVGIGATSRGDRIYVTEGQGERQTVVFDRDGAVLMRLSPPGTVPGGRIPVSVAVAPSGDVYVADRFRAVIDIYSSNGDHQGVFESANASETPEAPLGVAFDNLGNLYVTDLKPGEHRLLVYSPEGRLQLTFGKEGDEAAQFSFPYGIAVDAQGQIYVADSNNGRIQLFDRAGNLIDLIGRGARGELGIPRGIAVDDSGRLFVVDLTGHTVEVWDIAAAPRRLFVFGESGFGNGQLAYPNGLALDTTGRVYVVDRSNNRVQVWAH